MLFVRDKGKIQQLTIEQICKLREFNKLGTFAEVSEDGVNWSPIGDIAELNPMPPQQLLPDEAVEEFAQPVQNWPEEANPYEAPESTSAPPEDAEWFYAIGEQQLGPYSIQQMHQFIITGVLTRGMLVYSANHSDQWVPLESVPSFIQFIQNSPVNVATGGRELEPHRGAMILTFGLIGFFTPILVFSIIAWVMGAEDLKKMKNGVMDKSGYGSTQAGYILGIIVCLLLVGVIGFFCIFWLIGLSVLSGGALVSYFTV